jgi:hypothetical protein
MAACSLLSAGSTVHPIFVSVVEIEHNATEKTLEVSCKIFTDDFEKALRDTYKTHVDLVEPKSREAMGKLVSDYVLKHLSLQVNGKACTLQYKGYEQLEEAIYSYYQVDEVATVKTISVKDNILYEFKPEQIQLLHITVNGNRKSTKLQNPDDKISIEF